MSATEFKPVIARSFASPSTVTTPHCSAKVKRAAKTSLVQPPGVHKRQELRLPILTYLFTSSLLVPGIYFMQRPLGINLRLIKETQDIS